MRFDNFSAVEAGIVRNKPKGNGSVVGLPLSPIVTRRLRNRANGNYFFGATGDNGFITYSLFQGQIVPNAIINDIGASYIESPQNEFDLGIRDINAGDFEIVSVNDTSAQDPTSPLKNISGFDVKNGAVVTIRLNKDVEVLVPTTEESALIQSGELEATTMADPSVLRTETATQPTLADNKSLRNLLLVALALYGGYIALKLSSKK